MAKNDIRDVALFGLLVALIAVVIVFGSVFLKGSSDENHDAVRRVKALVNTVAQGSVENAWTAVAPETQDATSVETFRERVDGHPAFGPGNDYDLGLEELADGEVRVIGTISSDRGEFPVEALAVPAGSKYLVKSLSVGETVILP